MLYSYKEKKKGYIYVIESFGLYKIGCAINITSRMSDFRTHNPNCRCIYYREVWGYRKMEKHLHNIFSLNRIQGEWFKLGRGGLLKIKYFCEKEAVNQTKELVSLKESVG